MAPKAAANGKIGEPKPIDANIVVLLIAAFATRNGGSTTVDFKLMETLGKLQETKVPTASALEHKFRALRAEAAALLRQQGDGTTDTPKENRKAKTDPSKNTAPNSKGSTRHRKDSKLDDSNSAVEDDAAKTRCKPGKRKSDADFPSDASEGDNAGKRLKIEDGQAGISADEVV